MLFFLPQCPTQTRPLILRPLMNLLLITNHCRILFLKVIFISIEQPPMQRFLHISKTSDRSGFPLLFTILDFVSTPPYSQAKEIPCWQ